jgi:hypothetical protein
MFRRFEMVLIANRRMGDQFAGQKGTVIWRDRPSFDRRAGKWKEWGYCVWLPGIGRYGSYLESDLTPTGEFDTEQAHLGTQHEISFDIVMRDDMGIVEGSYRLPGHLWQIFLFTKTDVPEIEHDFVTWQSGITGVEFIIPNRITLNQNFIIGAISELFGATSWVVVPGPDSLILK